MISDISIVSIILTILLVGVSLGGLIFAGQRMMYKLLDDLRKEMLEMRKEMNDMHKEQADFREQVAGRLGKVEGLLEGLREFLTSRRAA